MAGGAWRRTVVERLKVASRGVVHVCRVAARRPAPRRIRVPVEAVPVPETSEQGPAHVVHRLQVGSADVLLDLEPGPVTAELRRAFGSALVEVEPAGRPIRHRVELAPPAPDRGGVPWAIVRSSGQELPAGPCDELLTALLPVLQADQLAAEPRWTHVHAGGAVVDGRAVLIPGRSRTGKTVLSIRLAGRGDGLLNDEMVVIDPEAAMVRAAERPLSIKPGAFDLVARDLVPGAPGPPDGRSTPWWAPASDLGLRTVAAAPPGAVLLVRRGLGPVTVAPASPLRALEVLLASTFDVDRRPGERLAQLVWLVSSAMLLQVDYEDAGAGADAVVEALCDPPTADGPGLEVLAPTTTDGPVRPAQGVWTVLGEREALVYDEATRRIFRLEGTALDGWRGVLDGAPPADDLVAELGELGLLGGGAR